MFFMDGTQKKNEIVKESYNTLILCCFFIYEIKKKIVTNNKKRLNSYIWHSGCPNYQITAFVSFFQDCWVVEGRLGWLYLINSLQIKEWYNSFIICKILLYIFNIFLFDKHLKLNGKMFVTQNVLHSCHFLQHISLGFFSGKRYFNDILWIQEYDNNTLLLAAIRYKKTRNTTIES